jgi:hypothetical protein
MAKHAGFQPLGPGRWPDSLRSHATQQVRWPAGVSSSTRRATPREQGCFLHRRGCRTSTVHEEGSEACEHPPGSGGRPILLGPAATQTGSLVVVGAGAS